MAPVGRSRTKLIGTGLLIVTLAAMTTQELPRGAPEQFEPVELIEMIAQIESGEAETEAKANADDPTLVPMATPCNMRRPRMALGVEQSWRHRFAAATITTDPELRQSILLELLASAPDEMSRWRIDVALIENALRLDATADATFHLERAATRNVPETCRSDEAFYAAAISETPKEAADLLALAVRQDPGFWAAHERLALLSAAGTGTDPTTCEADAVRTLESVVQLGALAQRDTQFQRLNRAIEAMPANGRTSLLRGMILRQTGEIDAARQAYAQGLASLDSSACDAVLRRGLEGMLATLEVSQ